MSAPTVAELRATLSSLSLDSRGNKQTLKQRLAKHRSKTSSSSASTSTSTVLGHRRGDNEDDDEEEEEEEETRPSGEIYDSFLMFDVEATCELIEGPHTPRLAFSYPNEIIEWPVILLQWRRIEPPTPPLNEEEAEEGGSEWELAPIDEFHSFVRPNWKPQLSAFCTELTGITQDQVDSAPRFQKLLKKFEKEFINKHGLFTKENKTIWVTDGPWDLRDFVAKTCYLSKVPRPDWLAGEIIDLKLLASHFFSNIKRKHTSPTPSPPPPTTSTTSTPTIPSSPPPPRLWTSRKPDPPIPISPDTPRYITDSSLLTSPPDLSIPSLLSSLTLPPFQGRLHSGLSDARNMSRILIDLAKRGQVELVGNRKVPDGGKGGRERRWDWMGKRGSVHEGEVRWEEFKRKEEGKLLSREK